jgi:hypothetical protein
VLVAVLAGQRRGDLVQVETTQVRHAARIDPSGPPGHTPLAEVHRSAPASTAAVLSSRRR